MSIFYNYNKYNMNIMKVSFEKKKKNYFFLNYKFIIFISLDEFFHLKTKILNYNLSSMVLNKNYIKSLFNLPNFYFLNNINILCIFIENESIFFDFIKSLENKQFFYSYMSRFSNIVNNNVILEYKKYNKNYIYIQFFLKKIKIKIIILFLFLLLSLIKYIK